MKYSIKEMFGYGYKWVGVIPMNMQEAKNRFKCLNEAILILFADGTESYIDNVTLFDEHKDKVMYALEYSDLELELIQRALYAMDTLSESLYQEDENGEEIENRNRPNDLMDCGRIDAEYETWNQVLNIIGFSNEDIELILKEGEW